MDRVTRQIETRVARGGKPPTVEEAALLRSLQRLLGEDDYRQEWSLLQDGGRLARQDVSCMRLLARLKRSREQSDPVPAAVRYFALSRNASPVDEGHEKYGLPTSDRESHFALLR